jgi:hypothetical protein
MSEVVNIPDAVLRLTIEAVLKNPAGEEITVENMNSSSNF